MALFRAITAEEEAATAIIHALRQHRYPGAELLHRTKHQHKQAFVPFLAAISAFGKEMAGAEPRLEILEQASTGKKKLNAYLLVTLKGERHKVSNEPPLDVTIETAEGGPLFTKNLADFARLLGVPKVLSHIKQRAQRRNQLLYATDKGFPIVTSDVAPFILSRRNDVFLLLAVYLLIEPYPKHQALVVQCLRELLTVIEALPLDEQLNGSDDVTESA